MEATGIRDGDETAIVIYVNKESIGEITTRAISPNEVAAAVYTNDENSLVAMYEALKVATNCVRHHLEKPSLRRMIEERVQELRHHAGEEAGNSHSPIDVDDIPF